MALTGEEQLQAVSEARLDEAIRAAQECVLSLQRPSGDWFLELEGDSILESEFILLLHSLGKSRGPLAQKLAAYLRQIQTASGGWAPYPDGADDVSATVKAYFALKLVGDSPSEPHMRWARAAALRLGGVPATNSFTKIYLALFGQYRWEDVPAIPPEIILLPSWFYFNIYAMSSWSRTILVPLSIIWAYRPRFNVVQECGIDELFPGGREGADCSLKANAPFPSWRHFFLLVDRALKALDALPVRPWRSRALAEAERWMIARFRKSDGLGAIFPPIVNSVWALLCRGFKADSPEVASQLNELNRLVIEEPTTARVQPCTSPVWDTAIASVALGASGVSPDHPAMKVAAQWLLEKEVREPGDWKVTRPDLQPGGWYFEYANEFYPDVDDTAMVLLSMHHLGHPSPEVEQRALDWVLGMQCKNGGWASFDADNDRSLLCEFPFADHNAMIDPPTADITARVLEMLATRGYNSGDACIAAAIRFLRDEQEPDGSWFGRWGVNYVYGTWQALRGLTAIGVPTSDSMVQRGARWLKTVQNPDGGWGESCDSYERGASRASGPSTASQTAWAVMGLISAREAHSDSVERGIRYLIETQGADGNWEEPYFTGTGFPRVFYLKYHLYRLFFPLYALGMYRETVARV